MEAIMADEFWFHYHKMYECLDMITPLDDFTEIFEADNPEVQQQVENNDKAKKGVGDHIKGMINAIINTLKNIASSITNFFRKLKMSGDERKAYEDFKAKAANDPKLRNMKVTVKNYKEIQADYERIIKEAEAADKAIASGQRNECQKLLDDMKNFTAGLGKTVGTSYAMEVALRQAAANKRDAQKIQTFLSIDMGICNEILENVGEKNYNKFMKDIDTLAKRNSLRATLMRAKMNMHQAYSNDLMENCKKVWGDLTDIGTGGATAANYISKATSDDLHSAKDVANRVKEMRDIRKNGGKAGYGSRRLIKQMSGTETGEAIKQTGKEIAKGYIKGKKDANKANRDAKKAEFLDNVERRIIDAAGKK